MSLIDEDQVEIQCINWFKDLGYKYKSGYVNFVNLEIILYKIDWLYLHSSGHKRINYQWIDNNNGVIDDLELSAIRLSENSFANLQDSVFITGENQSNLFFGKATSPPELDDGDYSLVLTFTDQALNIDTLILTNFTIDRTGPEYDNPLFISAITSVYRNTYLEQNFPASSYYWNRNSTEIGVTVDLPTDSSLLGGSIQLKGKVGNGSYQDLGPIESIPLKGDIKFREKKIESENTALLIIDVQKGEYNKEFIKNNPNEKYLFDRIKNKVIPNGKKLIESCRNKKIEVIYTVVESLTLDGRDRGLDYKISGIFAAKGSWQAEVVDELKPLKNEIIIPKTSSSLFNSTNFEYVLRNLSIQYLLVMGIVTDQCVETAVRDGCDRGFLVTLIEDACATHSQQRHDESLIGIKGYCRIRKTEEILEEIA